MERYNFSREIVEFSYIWQQNKTKHHISRQTIVATNRAHVAGSFIPISLRATIDAGEISERRFRNKTEILVKSSKKNPVGGRKRRRNIKGKIKMI